MIWPLPAPLTSSSSLSCVHVGFGAILHIRQHIAASEPLHLPPWLLDPSSPNSSVGHSSPSFRSPVKGCSPERLPIILQFSLFTSFQSTCNPCHIPFICIHLYVTCLSHWNASSVRADFDYCSSPRLRTGAWLIHC